MKKKGRVVKRLIPFLLAFAIFIMTGITDTAKIYAATNSSNRYNVVIVMDASGSMKHTDPNGYRYDALEQFLALLADQGNYVGGIIFSTDIDATQDIVGVSSQTDKDTIYNKLSSIQVANDTNIGLALQTAVDMLEQNGNTNLPSIILFLSDGNTDLDNDSSKTSKEEETSLQTKANAIQEARDKGIKIYSICLNVNGGADTAEMDQVANATGTEGQVVTTPEELTQSFAYLYEQVYGTSIRNILDQSTFPASGILTANFTVPGSGVEEINIMIQGKANSVKLYKPDGSEAAITVVKARSSDYIYIKSTDIASGDWKFEAQGASGDSIKVNLIYNCNLNVQLTTDPSSTTIAEGDAFTASATLYSGTTAATSDADYTGYTANLEVMDAYKNVIDTIPMTVSGGKFIVSPNLTQGTYYLNAVISGSHMEDLTSGMVGPITVTLPNVVVSENHAPTPVVDPLFEKVTIWPFKDNSITIDMTSLATDPDGDEIQYAVTDSSLIQGTSKDDGDFYVDGNQITVTKYSLRTGEIIITATDPGGLSCDIRIRISSVNVGLITLLLLGFAVLVGLIILVCTIYHFSKARLNGDLEVKANISNQISGMKITRGRGKIKLSQFRLAPTGLVPTKSYIQCTGQEVVWLYTDKPVMYNGNKKNKIDVHSGVPVIITTDIGAKITVKFDFHGKIKKMRPHVGSASGTGTHRSGNVGPSGIGAAGASRTNSQRTSGKGHFGGNNAARPNGQRPFGSGGFGGGNSKRP